MKVSFLADQKQFIPHDCSVVFQRMGTVNAQQIP